MPVVPHNGSALSPDENIAVAVVQWHAYTSSRPVTKVKQLWPRLWPWMGGHRIEGDHAKKKLTKHTRNPKWHVWLQHGCVLAPQ